MYHALSRTVAESPPRAGLRPVSLFLTHFCFAQAGGSLRTGRAGIVSVRLVLGHMGQPASSWRVGWRCGFTSAPAGGAVGAGTRGDAGHHFVLAVRLAQAPEGMSGSILPYVFLVVLFCAGCVSDPVQLSNAPLLCTDGFVRVSLLRLSAWQLPSSGVPWHVHRLVRACCKLNSSTLLLGQKQMWNEAGLAQRWSTADIQGRIFHVMLIVVPHLLTLVEAVVSMLQQQAGEGTVA